MQDKRIIFILIGIFVTFLAFLDTNAAVIEPVKACVLPNYDRLTYADRIQIARCLGYTSDPTVPLCHGKYPELSVAPVSDDETVHITADSVTYNSDAKPSKVEGSVEVQQGQRIVYADTAYIYKNPKNNTIEKIILLDRVKVLEPDHLVLAKKAEIYPQTKSGRMDKVLYLFNEKRKNALLPSWGRALFIERFPNKDSLLAKATYTTCAPTDKAWELQAEKIKIYDAEDVGVARDAVLKVRDTPILYTPYFSFPTSKKRKSGFLWPVPGYSSTGGFDVAIPYYWNMAPNYDSTITAHPYSKRGLMMGGLFRYLSVNSMSAIEGNILPKDRAFNKFINNNVVDYPQLEGLSNNRWSILGKNTTKIGSNAQLDIDYQQVSDDYYLQDFTTNLAFATERQLRKQADLMYITTNWFFTAMAQGFQTLNPINESVVSDIYRRLPQLMALGNYMDLPFNARLRLLGQYDQFEWPSRLIPQPEGPRLHLNPMLSVPIIDRTWGYVTPSIQWVGNFYNVKHHVLIPNQPTNVHQPETFNFYKAAVDAGLFFDRQTYFGNEAFTQTLEPRLFYLQVPYRNQSFVPAYDSAYMIFSVDQLFRMNRFSGYDRIGDANQLTYALKTRWISDRTGMERASLTVGQIRYFRDRKVQLCYQFDGNCIDTPLALGYLSGTYPYSPLAARGIYRFSNVFSVISDYVWDFAANQTNNAQVTFHYQPAENAVLQLGYTWLVNGDNTFVRGNSPQNSDLHQASVAIAWPLTERWSTLGAYGYNISKKYSMMGLLGLQYDSCCWAMRIVGGRSFKSLSPLNQPEYNNNIYLQILLKGLGSVAVVDPSKVINTWIPGYRDPFQI